MAVVYVSTGTGFRNPGRLVVAGIGVAALATAFTQYVVYAVERDNATALTAYINGSLAARSWDHTVTIGLVLLVAAPLTALVSRRLEMGEMGDELAAGLGAEPRSTKTWAVLLSIVLSAGAVSVAGPIAFISLTAPQIARRLTRGPGRTCSSPRSPAPCCWSSPTSRPSRCRGSTTCPSASTPWPSAASTSAICSPANGGRETCEDSGEELRGPHPGLPGRRGRAAGEGARRARGHPLLRRRAGRPRRHPGPAARRPHRDHRPQRLRQVHPAQGVRPHPRRSRAPSTCTAPTCTPTGARRRPGTSPCCRRARSPPTASPSGTWSAGAATRTTPCYASGRPTTTGPSPSPWTAPA